MPGSEFRLLPMLPVEFNLYRVIKPWDIGKAMQKGWVAVAALNYKRYVKDYGVIDETRYLVGKNPKEQVLVPVSHRVPLGVPELRGGVVGPELSYPQPVDDLVPPVAQEEAPPDTAPAPEDNPGIEEDIAQVQRDMDELLGDDGSQDDD